MESKSAILFVLLFVLISLSGCINQSGIIQVSPNITDYSYTPIVNNTDLAPTYGTGERVQGTLYWANNTPINVYVFCHTMGAGDLAIILTVNGTIVQDDNSHVIGSDAGNRSKWYHIPYGASYKIDITGTNIHHYSWWEYPYAWTKIK